MNIYVFFYLEEVVDLLYLLLSNNLMDYDIKLEQIHYEDMNKYLLIREL